MESKSADSNKKDSVMRLHAKNVKLFREKYTGQTVVHWCDGEPKAINYDYKKPV